MKKPFKLDESLARIDDTKIHASIRIILEIDSDANHDANSDVNDANLTDNERAVLKIITAQPELSASKIATEIGVSRPTVQRALQSLKKKKRIYREGATRGKWIVL